MSDKIKNPLKSSEQLWLGLITVTEGHKGAPKNPQEKNTINTFLFENFFTWVVQRLSSKNYNKV